MQNPRLRRLPGRPLVPVVRRGADRPGEGGEARPHRRAAHEPRQSRPVLAGAAAREPSRPRCCRSPWRRAPRPLPTAPGGGGGGLTVDAMDTPPCAPRRRPPVSRTAPPRPGRPAAGEDVARRRPASPRRRAGRGTSPTCAGRPSSTRGRSGAARAVRSCPTTSSCTREPATGCRCSASTTRTPSRRRPSTWSSRPA